MVRRWALRLTKLVASECRSKCGQTRRSMPERFASTRIILRTSCDCHWCPWQKQVVRKERLPFGFELILTPRQILFEHAQPLAGDRDGALLVELAFLQPDHAVRDVQITDTQVAELVVPNTAVGERGHHGLLSHVAGGVRHDGDPRDVPILV